MLVVEGSTDMLSFSKSTLPAIMEADKLLVKIGNLGGIGLKRGHHSQAVDSAKFIAEKSPWSIF